MSEKEILGRRHKVYTDKTTAPQSLSKNNVKVVKILKGSLDLIPSPLPSEKIQITGKKVCLRCNGKTLQGIVSKLLKTKSLLISPASSIVLFYYLK